MKIRTRSFAKKDSTASRRGLGPEFVVLAKNIDAVALIIWKAARFGLYRQAATGWSHTHVYLFHLQTRCYASPSFAGSGCTGTPAEIFCKLPTMILSPSFTPLSMTIRLP